MKLPDLSYNAGVKTDDELSLDHRLILSLWNELNDKQLNTIEGFNKEDLWNIHKLIIEELKKRGLQNLIVQEDLKGVTFEENPGMRAIKNLGSFVVSKEFISLAGSSAEGKEDAKDIDVIIKLNKRNESIEQKLIQQPGLKDVYPNVHFVYDANGSHGKHIAIYDLIAVKREDITIETPSYSFPLFGAAPTTARQQCSVARPNGIAAFLHKENDRAELLDEDGNRFYEFPEIESMCALMAKPEAFILFGFIQSDGKFIACDILRWNSTELVNSSTEDRTVFFDKIPWCSHIYRADKEQESIELEEIILMKPFIPLKVRAGYGEYEFNDINNLIKFWAAGDYLNKGIAVEEKFDGFRHVMHKRGKDIKIFTEDKKRDRAENLTGIASDLRNLKDGELILDSEVVAYDDKGKALPRHESARIVSAKGPVQGNIKANIFDILWHNGKSLINEPWSKRQEILKSVFPNDTKNLRRVVPIIAKNESDLKDAFNKLSSIQGSEGIMAKVTDSPYALSGRTPYWAKLKIVSELHGKVIGIRQKRISGQPTDTYLYRVGFLKNHGANELVPMESQKKLGPADMKEESEWQMGLGFNRRRIGETAYGETYGTSIKAKIGDIITVLPIHILEIGSKDDPRFAWMFPRFRNLETAVTIPDDIDELRRVAAMKRSGEVKETEFSEFLNSLKETDFPLTIKEVINA
jgi:hypothetical protein